MRAPRVFAFAFSGETPVLISSTVVEVGVDVPEASVMMVEDARVFGLSQLHQLRGRVGRGTKASRCFLMAPSPSVDGAEKATERLRVLERSSDGLTIAEHDLRIRCVVPALPVDTVVSPGCDSCYHTHLHGGQGGFQVVTCGHCCVSWVSWRFPGSYLSL